jgi:dipeptidyl aminopeptidase/acylaminoacyl peptidase
VENLHWGSDGRSVEGWLVYPQPYDGRRRYPLIVVIHGGPANQMSASWPEATRFDPCVLSCHGYFVLCPNIRGSYGQGEAYTQGNVKDYAFGPLRDLLAGVDHVIATHSVDPDRLGVAGGSDGGSTTMFTVTQTHRFRAAVAEAGFSDAFAKYGQTSIDQWMPFYFGATAYDDPEAYRKVSAITYVRNVRTPTLLIVGAGDKLNPPAQSIEFWHALEREGVPSQLVIYNGEGHGPRSKRHIEDRMDRIVRWFDRFLQ